MREKFLCTIPQCVISGYSLTINLNDVTFNVPNANYTVEVDNNFLKYEGYDELVPGIKPDLWIIQTTGGKPIEMVITDS